MLTADKRVQKVVAGRRGVCSLIGTLVSYLRILSTALAAPGRLRLWRPFLYATGGEGGRAGGAVVTEAAGAKLQLFARKRAAREACRETGSEERRREKSMLMRAECSFARLQTSASAKGRVGRHATPPAFSRATPARRPGRWDVSAPDWRPVEPPFNWKLL